MTVDAYSVIAAGRARGLSTATIARQLGLRDGEQAYGVMRQDFDREAVVVVPSDRPPVIRRPEMVKPAKPQSQRGRNQYSREPDRLLAEAIMTAGLACMAELPQRSRERHLIRQSSMYLIYAMARLIMVDIAEMFGFASGDHGPARFAIKATRDRMNDPERARAEAARQKQIKDALAQK